ncbi:hypothetical protein [Thiomonas sp. FB-Cd]|uniref:hypothetical protein n=1 Tax=Thiomonas sp. FB-Cd TaxID=1158292 RepID=UPI001E64D89C|nr:hypothetical protein [Thiomonas sp. FB-Cd]
MAKAYGMVAGLVLLASVWVIGAVTMIPWIMYGVEGKRRSLEGMVAGALAS